MDSIQSFRIAAKALRAQAAADNGNKAFSRPRIAAARHLEQEARERAAAAREAKGRPYKDNDLFHADPKCEHRVVSGPGGGIRCVKCPGWFCY